jgi:hypothetical protein
MYNNGTAPWPWRYALCLYLCWLTNYMCYVLKLVLHLKWSEKT